MMFYLNRLLILALLLNIVSSENCDQHGVLVYQDIACEPVKSQTDECPSEYKCDFARPKNGCSFKGRSYTPGEEITSNLTYSGCSIGCSCEDFDYIRCAILDCPENLGDIVPPGCYHEYKLGKCCSIGQICNNSTSVGKQCKVDGKAYKIGEKFYPKNTCLSCVCHENFTGEYDEITCERFNCLTQIHHTEELNKKCAPAYFTFHSDEVLCCPDDFVCPDPDNDTIKVVNFDADLNSTLRCEYGNQQLKLGEGFSRHVNKYGKDRNLKCECMIPPLVTCKEV